jgi:methylthioribose-1-phosphate isomerase
MVLQAIRYERGSLQILNQLLLPHAIKYDNIRNGQDAWHAIRDMRTRGAPAIAIVAALGLAVELTTTICPSPSPSSPSQAEAVRIITDSLDILITSRPTAVNLMDAATKLKAVAEKAEGSGIQVIDAYVAAAEKMLVDDVADNEAIGRFGAQWISENTEFGKQGKVSVVTHCNTG